jgi:hypothetical protein
MRSDVCEWDMEILSGNNFLRGISSAIMGNNTSQHILGTSANLLGFCLFVITSLHVSNYSAASIIDELTSAIAVLLICSCMFSFFSIRTSYPKKGKKLEAIADYLFVAALIGILIILVLIAFNYIK